MMKAVKAGAVSSALLMVCAQPCLASTSFDQGSAMSRPAAFAGASVRLELGKPKARPDARLQLGMTRTQGANGEALMQLRGLELGRSKSGKAAFYVNGMETRQVQQKLGIGGSTGTYVLIGAGVLLLVVLAAYASASADLLDFCDDQPECTD
jgi:hypothetical protein